MICELKYSIVKVRPLKVMCKHQNIFVQFTRTNVKNTIFDARQDKIKYIYILVLNDSNFMTMNVVTAVVHRWKMKRQWTGDWMREKTALWMEIPMWPLCLLHVGFSQLNTDIILYKIYQLILYLYIYMYIEFGFWHDSAYLLT